MRSPPAAREPSPVHWRLEPRAHGRDAHATSMQSTSNQQRLSEGLDHHRAGRLQQAEVIYRQILQEKPDEPEALNLLGVIALQVGRADAAVPLLSRSVQVAPGFGSLNNLGESLRYLGRLDEAIAAYR